MTNETILKTFNLRHACKRFDSTRQVDEKDFETILESGRLSPSSFGFEPWHFIVVQNPQLRQRLREVTWGAEDQLPTASYFVVILHRRAKDLRPGSAYVQDHLSRIRGMDEQTQGVIKSYFENFQKEDFNLRSDEALEAWAARQTYIPLGNMMTTAMMLGVDSCPIEGFSLDKVEALLRETGTADMDSYRVSCMVSFGYRVKEPRAKTRRQKSEVISWVK